MRRFSEELTFNLGLVLTYWFTSKTQFSLLPLTVIHAVTGAILAFYIVGHSIRIASLGSTRFNQISLRGRLAFDVALSIVCLTMVSIGLTVLYLLNEVNLTLLLASVTIGSNIVEIARHQLPAGIRPMTIIPNASVTGITVFGMLVAFVFRRAFAWPSMPGWDIYVHLGVSNWIFAHNGSSNIIAIGNNLLSAYPYLFHILVASVSYVLGSNPYALLWAGSFYSIPLYGLLIYALAAFLTQCKIQSVFAGCLAISISGGEALLGPQYFFPSTAFILVFILCLVAIAESPLRGMPQIVFSVTALATCYLLYPYTVFLSLGPLIIVIMKRNPNSFHPRRRRPIIVATFGASILLTYVGSQLLSLGDLSSSPKLALLTAAYPIVLWLLIAVGGLVIMYRLFFNRIPGYWDHLILAYVGTILVLYFLPLQISYRSELMLRPFAAIVASYSMAALIWIVTSTKASGTNLARVLATARLPAKVSVALLLIISIFLVVQPYFTYSQQVPTWSNLSNDEYQAAQWLAQRTPTNGYILTDPSTGFVFRGLTLLNSSSSFIIRGHTPSPEGYPYLTSIIYGFFTAQDITETQSYLNALPQKPDFIVVTTRTASWADGGINSTFPAPTVNMPNSFSGYEKFSTPLFVLAASWDTVMIYRLK